MIRKSVFAIVGGMAFATVLSLAVPASAVSCLGLCSDRVGHYYFAGCQLTMICPYGFTSFYECTIEDVTCNYTEGPSPVDPNIAE